MIQNNKRKLLGKIELTGILECITGLHIGASKENMEIGALDTPVVRDPITREPYIPGSSLKGKLRALLEKAHPTIPPNRPSGSAGNLVWRHECDNKDDASQCPVCRLFGSTGKKENNQSGENYPARVMVRDLRLLTQKDLEEYDVPKDEWCKYKTIGDLEKIDTGLLYTEWKFENSIDRITSAANPRNLERVPKGAMFKFSIIYDVEDKSTLNEDIINLRLARQLLHDDSLGGHGSRGYGQVKMDFKKIEVKSLDYYKGEKAQPKIFTSIEEITKAKDELHKFFEDTQHEQGPSS